MNEQDGLMTHEEWVEFFIDEFSYRRDVAESCADVALFNNWTN